MRVTQHENMYILFSSQLSVPRAAAAAATDFAFVMHLMNRASALLKCDLENTNGVFVLRGAWGTKNTHSERTGCRFGQIELSPCRARSRVAFHHGSRIILRVKP